MTRKPSGKGITRRDLLGTAAGGALALALPAAKATPPRAEPLDVGDRKQLFLDDRFSAESRNVTWAMNPPEKLGVVLDSQREPWEKGTGGYFRVIQEGERCRLYYGAFTDAGHSLCYAESEDGLHWVKPSLGLVEMRGSRKNNILLPDNAIDGTIMVDPRDVPARRYKLFRSYVSDDPKTAGVYASCSADGIHFTDAGRVLPMWPETSLIADYDPSVGKYVVFLRIFVRNVENQRRVGRLVTDDLLKPWPYHPTTPLLSPPSPENIQMVLAADEQDDPYCDLYTNGAHRYAEAQDVYLMFPSVFRHFAPPRQPWFNFDPGNDYGLIETQMAVSRDGIHWLRPDRRPYVPMGLADEWDRWLMMMGVGMVRKGSYLYQYYWSPGLTHDGGMLRPEYAKFTPRSSAIGAVRQRLDGFISADFATAGGTLTTSPLAFKGTHLRLNIDTGGMGTAFVELRSQDGRPLPGYARADCEEIGGNFIDTPVRWKGKADLSALQDRPVVLHIAARRAKLYAFQFVSGPPPT